MDELYAVHMAGGEQAVKHILNDMRMEGIPNSRVEGGMKFRLRQNTGRHNRSTGGVGPLAAWQNTPEPVPAKELRQALKAGFDESRQTLVASGSSQKEVDKAIKQT